MKRNVDYVSMENGKAATETSSPLHRHMKLLHSTRFMPDNFPRMNGSNLTVEVLQHYGLEYPVIFNLPDGTPRRIRFIFASFRLFN